MTFLLYNIHLLQGAQLDWAIKIPTIATVAETTLLNKSTLDKEQLSNYRPISNLFLISKIIERIVKSRLTDYLSSNNLLNPHQSAYCKHHSTETALSYIHDHLINAIGSQKLSCLSSWPLCSIWYHRSQYFNHSSFILVWDSWLRSQLI